MKLTPISSLLTYHLNLITRIREVQEMARKPKRDMTMEQQLAAGPVDLPFLMLALMLVEKLFLFRFLDKSKGHRAPVCDLFPAVDVGGFCQSRMCSSWACILRGCFRFSGRVLRGRSHWITCRNGSPTGRCLWWACCFPRRFRPGCLRKSGKNGQVRCTS